MYVNDIMTMKRNGCYRCSIYEKRYQLYFNRKNIKPSVTWNIVHSYNITLLKFHKCKNIFRDEMILIR